MGSTESKSIKKEHALSCPKTRIKSLRQLHRADHIAFWRMSLPIWHHCIVKEVNVEKEKVLVRHYSNTANEFIGGGSKILATVREEWIEINCAKDDLYRIDYPSEQCFTEDEVIHNTERRLGESTYSPFTNNCEHFARWCKIGESSSLQVEDMKRGFKTFLAQSGGKILKTVGQDGLEALLKTSVKQGGKRVAVKCTAEIGGAVVILAGEVYEFTKAILKAWRQYHEGYLEFNEFAKVIANEFGKCSASTICAIVGDLLGQLFIPIPYLGGLVGGLLGLILGKCFGPFIGRIYAYLVELIIVVFGNTSPSLQEIDSAKNK